MYGDSFFLNAPALHKAVGKSYRLVQGELREQHTLQKSIESLFYPRICFDHRFDRYLVPDRWGTSRIESSCGAFRDLCRTLGTDLLRAFGKTPRRRHRRPIDPDADATLNSGPGIYRCRSVIFDPGNGTGQTSSPVKLRAWSSCPLFARATSEKKTASSRLASA